MDNINIDFETYSESNLLMIGAWKYSRHPSTEVICMAYSINGAEPILWSHGDPIPFTQDQLNNANIIAFNVFFERAIWTNVLKWPKPKAWEDTAAAVAALSLPRALGQVAKALGLPEDQQKDKRGKQLIQKLCKPQRNGERNRDKVLLKEFGEYCVQDVVTEQAVGKFVFELSHREKRVFEMDQKMNFRGLGVDIDAANVLDGIVEKCTERLNKEVAEITNGELVNVNSHMTVKKYMETRGFELENYQKATLAAALEGDELQDPVCRRLLEIRQSTGKTSTAKLKKLRAIADHGRAYGLLRYWGAGPGRWSGNLFQPQNLPRPSFKDTDNAIEFLKTNPPISLIETLYGDPMEVVSSCIRSLITVSNPETHNLICSDYSSIEPRVLAWLCGNERILKVFRENGDVYKYEAMGIFGCTLEEVTPERRFIGKVATLALGYQGGGRAFMAMAESYGLEISFEDAEEIKFAYRELNWQVEKLWADMNSAAIKAVQHPGKIVNCGRVAFKVFNNFLFMRLPSGRALSYYQPYIGEGKWGNPEVRFWGRDTYTGKFSEQSTYGGKLVENATQGLARDIMVDAMLDLEDLDKDGPLACDLVLTVHDELVGEVRVDSDWTVEKFESLITQVKPWAEGIPIAADGGYISKRYRK